MAMLSIFSCASEPSVSPAVPLVPSSDIAPAVQPSVQSVSDPAASVDPSNTKVHAAINKASAQNQPSAKVIMPNQASLTDSCKKQLKQFKSYVRTDEYLDKACEQAKVLDSCTSVDGVPIFHVDKSTNDKGAKNILVFSLIHGDETPAGTVGRFWIERLNKISPRNNWRVIPVLNPDGVRLKTRTNANKIDLNRNFPTKDWEINAVDYWKKQTGGQVRKYPGTEPASEPELKCAMKHLETYNPDFVVSIHTPLNVLDFDGPRVTSPNFDYLPWRSLGHYPGSLGRYMWFERKVPTLTAEFKAASPPNEKIIERLQDVIGSLVKLDQFK